MHHGVFANPHRTHRRGSAAAQAQGTPDDDSTVEGESREVDDDKK